MSRSQENDLSDALINSGSSVCFSAKRAKPSRPADNVPAGLLFQLGDLFRDVLVDDDRIVPLSLFQRRGDDHLLYAVQLVRDAHLVVLQADQYGASI